MFVLLEMSGLDIISVRVFKRVSDAVSVFESCAADNGVYEEPMSSHEAPGTIRVAGDDTYFVQLIETDVINSIKPRRQSC
jgi:hypothetical protein